MITRSLWLRGEEEGRNLLLQKSDLRKNPTFLTCLILFRDIFDEIRKSETIYDLFQRIMLHYYDSKPVIERQIFLQLLIYLSNTRKGLTLSEAEELLVKYDHFD